MQSNGLGISLVFGVHCLLYLCLKRFDKEVFEYSNEHNSPRGCHRKHHTRGRRVEKLCPAVLIPCKKSLVSRSSSKSRQLRRSRCSGILRLDFLSKFDVFAPAPAGVVPVAPYNPRNTDDPLDIEYRVENRIEKHGEDVQLKQSVLDKTYNCRSQVERTNGAIKDCGLGTLRPRPRPRTSADIPYPVPAARRCYHQLRTRRQFRKHGHHGMRLIL